MKTKRRFPKSIVEAVRKNSVIGIRSGSKKHRFIAIWAVVVNGRVFVRSWSIKPRSWYRTFLDEPRGTITVGSHKLAVRAIRTRSERLKAAVDGAYKEKYNTPGSLIFVKGFRLVKRRNTTTELVPL